MPKPSASSRTSILLLVLVYVLNIEWAEAEGMKIAVEGHKILVDGKPFHIKGVVYSPTPIGMSPTWYPYGDWFLNQYVEFWDRDFPIIKSMGANTIRILGWDNNADHTFFLNKLDEYGLKAIIQFNLGNAYQNPIREEWQRQNLLGTFKWQVSRYMNHPAVLAWNFGVEINGAWNGWLQSFSDSFGCGYNAGQFPYDPRGCYFNPDTSGFCGGPIECVYRNLFGFVNLAAQYAKDAMGPNNRPHLIFSSFADVDLVPQRLGQYEQYAPAIDAWGQQIYRGKDFGTGDADFIGAYARSSKKPLIITEYGVDAYNDPCGDSPTSPCYNTEETAPRGYGEDEDQQAEWTSALTKILLDQSSATDKGPVAGGLVMSYVDETWKGSMGVKGCWGPIPYGKPGFDPSQCEYKAHVTCPQADLGHSSLCGYPTPATFDNYANTAWYGVMKPQTVPNDQNKLKPRLVYAELRRHWAGPVSNTWMYLTITCAVISGGICLWVYTRWRSRLNEIAKTAFPVVGFRTVINGPSAGPSPNQSGFSYRSPQASSRSPLPGRSPTPPVPVPSSSGFASTPSRPSSASKSPTPPPSVQLNVDETTPLMSKSDKNSG